MRSVHEEAESEALVAGEWEESETLQKFSLRERESQENLEAKRKAIETYKKKYRTWFKEEAKRKKMFIDAKNATLKNLTHALKTTKDEKQQEALKQKLAVERLKYYNPVSPPFPGSSVPLITQVDIIGGKEIIPKPYDLEALTDLIEMNQRLKSSIMIYSRNSVGLGIDYRPANHIEVADMKDEDLEAYREQGRALLDWYNSRVEKGTHFSQLAYGVMYAKAGLGEGYFEIIDSADGKKINEIRFMLPTYIWEHRSRDRYVYIKDGRKKYYKKFDDLSVRNVDDFSEGALPEKRATRLLPFREFNLLSGINGVPMWTGSIPQVIGARYAEERNVTLQLNDATPKLAILVAGGAVDNSTKQTMKEFFSKGKGREHAGRTLLLCVSSKNALSPHAKPPTVTLQPLTVGTNEDASFMKYQEGCKETIREAFRVALTFFGTSGDANRASSYTLRDQTVEMVNRPEAELMAALCNDTFTQSFAKEKKLESKLNAEIYFKTPRTMSEKDARELTIAELTAGALTTNDYRAHMGLRKLDFWWAELPRTLAVTALQMAQFAPSMIATMTNYDEFGGAGSPTGQADVGLDEEHLTGEATKALVKVREALQSVLKTEHVCAEHLTIVDNLFSVAKDLQKEDEELIAKMLKKAEDE